MLSATILYVVRNYFTCCPRLFLLSATILNVVRDYFICCPQLFYMLSATILHFTLINVPQCFCHIITLFSITDNCHKIVCFIYPSLLQVQAIFTCTTSTQGGDLHSTIWMGWISYFWDSLGSAVCYY